MQRVELGIQELAGVFEMSDGRLAIAVAVLQHRQHGVARRIVRTQVQQTMEQRYRGATAGLIMQLGGAFQRGDVLRGDFQRMFERRQRVTDIALPGEGDALQGPELRVVRRRRQGGSSQRHRRVEISRTQGGTDGFDLILRGRADTCEPSAGGRKVDLGRFP